MFKPDGCHGWRVVDMASIARAEYSMRAHHARRRAHAATYAITHAPHYNPYNPAHVAYAARALLRTYRAAVGGG